MEALRAKSFKMSNVKVVEHDEGYAWVPSNIRLGEVDFFVVVAQTHFGKIGLGILKILVKTFL